MRFIDLPRFKHMSLPISWVTLRTRREVSTMTLAPSLRYRVGGDLRKDQTAAEGPSNRCFLVIEESCQLTPVEMGKGECFIVDEVVLKDGQAKPYLIGGRGGRAVHKPLTQTVDGAWPELPNNQQRINMILAGVPRRSVDTRTDS